MVVRGIPVLPESPTIDSLLEAAILNTFCAHFAFCSLSHHVGLRCFIEFFRLLSVVVTVPAVNVIFSAI